MIEVLDHRLYAGYIINNKDIIAYSLNSDKEKLIDHLNKIKKFHRLNGKIIFSDEIDKYFQELIDNKEKRKRFEINYDLYKYKEVYIELSKLDSLISYDDLRKRINKYSIFQIINALKYNPFIIIIPCHKVIKRNGDIGGYTPLGKEFKKNLIENDF